MKSLLRRKFWRDKIFPAKEMIGLKKKIFAALMSVALLFTGCLDDSAEFCASVARSKERPEFHCNDHQRRECHQ